MCTLKAVFLLSDDKRLDKWVSKEKLIELDETEQNNAQENRRSTRMQNKLKEVKNPTSETHSLNNPQIRQLEEKYQESTKVRLLSDEKH